MRAARPRVWTVGAPVEIRLRERENLFVWIRWALAVFGLGAVLADPGRWPALAWGAPVVIVLTNGAAILVPRRIRSVVGLRVLGAVVTVSDAAVAVASMFNYSDNADTATSLIVALVVMEAAVRWGIAGGAGAGVLVGIASMAWMVYREDVAGLDFEVSTAFARLGGYTIVGVFLGLIMRELDRAGEEVRRRLRRTDAVGRFAIDAPGLGVREAASQLAEILHDDLDFERAAVVLAHEGDATQFRLVATAGYEHLDLRPFQAFPITSGVVGRCYLTGQPQLIVDVSVDVSYLAVDPTTQSEMAVPLRGRSGVFGVIDVASSQRSAFDEEDLRFLETVAGQLGRAFDNARLAEMERRAMQELEELSAMKDDFIAIANHELRTPVTSIAGFAQSLLKQRDVLTQEEVDDAIERIARQSARLRSLLEDLLSVPTVETRSGQMALEPLDVLEIAREVVHELDPHDDRYRLDVIVDGDVGSASGDAVATRRVLVNLVSNAIRYSPDGGPITVTIRGAGHGVAVEVADEGVGINPDDVPRLFQKFGMLRAPGGTGGMGLGLFIVKGLVEQMGGRVGVDTEPERGSRFWFTLPPAAGLRQHSA